MLIDRGKQQKVDNRCAQRFSSGRRMVFLAETAVFASVIVSTGAETVLGRLQSLCGAAAGVVMCNCWPRLRGFLLGFSQRPQQIFYSGFGVILLKQPFNRDLL